MTGFSLITKNHINQLPNEKCVEIFANALHGDAWQIQIPISDITFTMETTVPDGGIDASVETKSSRTGILIVDSKTFYQIKSGETFKPWQKFTITRELFGCKEPTKYNLGSEILRCFENSGTYILVCMKVPLTTKQTHDAESHIRKCLEKCGISNPKIKVWGQEKIVSAINSFPALALEISGMENSRFQSHKDWTNHEDMRNQLFMGDKQEQFVNTVRNLLHNDRSVHLYVYGEPGIGKTRLVLEATKDPFLKPLVAYFTSSQKSIDDYLFRCMIRDPALTAILVVDECEYDHAQKIWNELSCSVSRLKLVTIHNENRQPSRSEQISVPCLTDEQVSRIFQIYYNDPIVADQLARLCKGIPRLAHIIGFDLKSNPGTILSKRLELEDFFDRYVNYGDDPRSDHAKQRKRVLYILALFKKFGFGDNFKDEMQAVHVLVMRIDPTITIGMFQEYVQELKQRKILQGEHTLYISPKALHIWLWGKCWELYGATLDFEDLVNNHLSEMLSVWFIDMFEYAPNSDAAKSILKKLFDKQDASPKSNFIKSGSGSTLFRLWASVEQRKALEYIEEVFGSWHDNRLAGFAYGECNIIYGLKTIVFESELFIRGGTLLRRLVEMENTFGTSSAKQLFIDLFSLGTGPTSMTKATPDTRLPLLKETLCTESAFRRDLGFQICESALQVFGSVSAPHFPGNDLRTTQNGWEPKTVSELQKAYEAIINLLVESIEIFSEEDKQRAVEIIYSCSRGLLRAFPSIDEYLLKCFTDISKYVDKEKSLDNISYILAFDGNKLKPEIKHKFEQLQNKLTGTSYASLMKRHVGMNLVSDWNKKNYEKERDDMIRNLAKESFEDVTKLKSQLDWLVRPNVTYAHIFGRELSKLDTEHSLLPIMLQAQRDAGEHGSEFFLSGYLRVIFENNVEQWNSIMVELSHDDILLQFFPDIAWRSGINDKIATLLLRLITDNKIDAITLSKFQIGGVIYAISESVVKQWVKTMFDTGRQEVILKAIELFYSFFVHRQPKNLDEQITFNLLMHDAFFDEVQPTNNDDMMTGMAWQMIAMEYIKHYPSKSIIIAEKILKNIGSSRIEIRRHSEVIEVLNAIAAGHPDEMWDIVIKYIVFPKDSRTLHIMHWIKNYSAYSRQEFIHTVNFKKISDWIDSDSTKHMKFIISITPSHLQKEDCLARKILVQYGKDEHVRRALTHNFALGAVYGSMVEHYKNKKDEFLAYRKTENNENVKRWIDHHTDWLDREIAKERLREEREF